MAREEDRADDGEERVSEQLGHLYDQISEIARVAPTCDPGMTRASLEKLRARWSVEDINWMIGVVADDFATMGV